MQGAVVHGLGVEVGDNICHSCMVTVLAVILGFARLFQRVQQLRQAGSRLSSPSSTPAVTEQVQTLTRPLGPAMRMSFLVFP